jgi:ATP-dependent Clp protease ATP-binding subunit ClpC
MTKPPDLTRSTSEIERLEQGEGRGGRRQDFEKAAELRDKADQAPQEEGAIQRSGAKSQARTAAVDEEVIAESSAR